jgi:hypothetical protein
VAGHAFQGLAYRRLPGAIAHAQELDLLLAAGLGLAYQHLGANAVIQAGRDGLGPAGGDGKFI